MNEAYFGIALALCLMSFISGMIVCLQIQRPAHKPAQQEMRPAASSHAIPAQKTVPLSAMAAVQTKTLRERRRERRTRPSSLWRSTGEFPAIQGGPRTEGYDLSRVKERLNKRG